MRQLDTNTLAEAQRNGAYPIELVSFILDPNDDTKNLYLNTGYANITFNNKTYTPGSRVLGFSAVEETQDIKTNAITIELNGVPTTIVTTLEGAGIKPAGGIVTIYQAFWDEAKGFVIMNTNNNPAIYQKWKGIIYSISTTEENQTSGTIKINVECKNILTAILDTKSGRFTSNTGFRQFNANDLSMEFVASTVNFNPFFGKEDN